MGWLTPKCPKCGGDLQSTGYCAPYPSHRCPSCISKHRDAAKIKKLTERIEKLESEATHD